jgi:preprotein translocase subunit SecD
MRRFIAYITLAVSALLMIAVTFSQVFVQTSSNIEYTDGRSLVYRISEDETDEQDTDGEISIEDGTAIKDIASTMENRLKTAEVSEYGIETIGNDTIKVTLSQPTEENYTQIKTYLSFNGAFALGTSTNVVAVGDAFMAQGTSYVSFINDYPTVVIPVNYENEEFKAVIAEAKKLNDGGETEVANAHRNVLNADEEEAPKTYVYLAYNWVEGDQFSQMIEGSEDYEAKKAEKLLIKFDISQIWFDDTETSIATAVEIDPDGDGAYSYTDIKNATQKAHFYCNLLNTEKLNYKVTFMYEKNAPAYFENIVSYGMKATVAWSRTFIAALIGILIISLLLAVFYRWAALTIGTFSIASAFLGLLFSIIFSVEFTIAGLIGYILVVIASLATGTIYVTKVKEECYRGRSLKKANAEGAKKALLPIVDVHVALIVLGAICYWLGGTAMVSFAAATVFGGLISLLLNTLVLKGMMWLLTNTTSFIGKYSVIGVDSKRVPNLINEEKQNYFGPYQDKDFTKKKKPIAIVTATLFVASLIGMVTFGALDGHLFNHGGTNRTNNYVYFETNVKTTSIDDAYIRGLLDNTQYYLNGDNEDKENIAYQLDPVYKRTDTEEKVEVTYTYLVATLDQSLTDDTVIVINYRGLEVEGTLDIVFTDYFEAQNDDEFATASFKVGESVTIDTPNSGLVIASSAVAVGILMLYFMLRYKLSRGLTSVVISILTGGITIGLFVLTRVITSEIAIFALPIVVFVTSIMSIMFMNKDREMAKDDFVRTKDNSYEHRNVIMVKATSLAFLPILIITVLAGYIAIDFFGFGPTSTSLIFIIGLIGIVLGALLVTTLYGPLSQFLFKLFSRVNINIAKPKKKKKLDLKSKKSAEPEEAVFIGIND